MLCSLVLFLAVETKSETAKTEYSDIVLIQENSIKATQSHLRPKNTLEGQFCGFSAILECVVQFESGGNEKAYNPMDIDGYPRFGLLQFYLPTWKSLCVQKYSLPDDIFNGNIQRECYYLMVRDGMSSHWPSYRLCN